MAHPIEHPKTSELEHGLDAALSAGLAGPARPRPVDPVAAPPPGAWGPSTPTPNGSLADQVATMNADAQRLIEMLEDMQAALAIIRKKLG